MINFTSYYAFANAFDTAMLGCPNRNPYKVGTFAHAEYERGYKEGAEERNNPKPKEVCKHVVNEAGICEECGEMLNVDEAGNYLD